MANKITVLLDLVTDKATTAAKGFKSSIAEAEGAANKFKAGASSAFATVQANAVGFAIAGGTAIAGFAAKSVAAFQDTALAAGKFSDATGLAVEDASRYQEVASDLGIAAGAIESDFKFLQKAIAGNTAEVKQLGIETKVTADGQVDVNETFLDAITRLQGVKDANQRALLASKLFGRGFAESAELILGNVDDLKARLDGVSKAQVISDKQVERARKFRDQMDQLSDNLKQVEIVVGDALIPVLGNLAEVLGGVETGAEKAADAIDKIPGGTDFLKKLFSGPQDVADEFLEHLRDLEEGLGFPERVDIGPLRDKFNEMVAAGNEANDVVDELGGTASTTADEVVDLGDKAANSGPKIGDMAGALKDARDAAAELNEEARDNALRILGDAAKAASDAIDQAFQDVRDQLDIEQLLDDITDQFGAVQEAADKLGEDGEAGLRNYRTEVRRLREQLLTLLGDIKNVSAQDKIKLAAEIERGSIDDLFRLLGELSKGVVVPVSFSSTPQAGFSGANISIPQPGSNAIPSFNLQGLNPAPINNSQTTIIYPVGSSPTTTFIDQRLYATRNGTNPR